MLITPPCCWRGRTDCAPMHSIESFPPAAEALPPEAFDDGLMDGSVRPLTFVCVGCVRAAARGLARDAYRLCWKSGGTDDIRDYDEQDLAHQAAVIGQALALLASRRMAGATIEVPTGAPEIAG